jgi:hypothetical protein
MSGSNNTRRTRSMKISKNWVPLALAVALAAISFPIYRAHADGNSQFQFNITPAASGAPAAISLAYDGSTIRFRGTGTFQPDDPEDVTGGGTWETRNNIGGVTGSGSWQPTRLLKWDLRPEIFAPDSRVKGGLAFFEITYSDGARGILAVSCFLPGAPPSVSEGIIASKDSILYGRHDVNTPPTFFVVL